MIAGALILAAGGSSRLTFPKQLVRLGGETLLERTVRVCTEAGCFPVVVVLGAYEEQIRNECDLRDVVAVSHPEWIAGMGTSLARGMQEFEEVTGVVILTCDMPDVTAANLIALQATGELTASSYAGRKGVPAYFPRAMFPELLTLRGDVGARTLLESARCVELPGGELDIDTDEDLGRARTVHD